MAQRLFMNGTCTAGPSGAGGGMARGKRRLGLNRATHRTDGLECCLVPLLVFGWLAVMAYRYSSRRLPPATVGGWAEAAGYRVLRQEERALWRGPFTWTSSGHQRVYRVAVRDALGLERSGWVRV